MITGGAGFIGSHTADALLARGHFVRILDNLDPQIHGPGHIFPAYVNGGAELICGDVRDKSSLASALRDVDVIYHFAAHTGVGQSMYAVRDYVDTNCTGTASLLEAMLAARGRISRMVLSSSRAVYGEGAYVCNVHGAVDPGPRAPERLAAGQFVPPCPKCGWPLEHRPTCESHASRPTSVYGWTKLQQEQLCHYASDVLGVETVILRYFNVIGARQSLTNPYTGIANVFYRNIIGGRPVQLYEQGKPIRDFVSVKDVVAANLRALDAVLPARTVHVNVGSGRENTILDLAVAIGDACERSATVERTRRYRAGDIFACVADLRVAQALLSYRPEYEMIDAVREFVDWAREQPEPEVPVEATETELERRGLLGGVRQDRQDRELE